MIKKQTSEWEELNLVQDVKSNYFDKIVTKPTETLYRLLDIENDFMISAFGLIQHKLF
jgi:hypothetical protein